MQEPPFSMQVEMVEGCNLYCDFCGLQGIRTRKDKNYKYMDMYDAATLAMQIRDADWNVRIEFAMHGEPTMHPNCADIIDIFRRTLPRHQLMMTSNGGGLLPDPLAKLEELFDNGLNLFAFDAYDAVKIKEKVDRSINNTSRSFDVHQYPESKISPHSRYPVGTRKFIRMDDISTATTGSHSSLNNHCGAAFPPLAEPLQARCAKPFREIAIRYDGMVAICCNDWRGQFQVGNVYDIGLEGVWQHPRYVTARKALYNRRRDLISPCDVCDAKSYRVGLLPDKKGKEDLPEPTQQELGDLLARPLLVKPNPRPWEI